MARRLIITADDMGYNVERNQGIVECFKNQAVTNSSLMVNGVASEDAAELALKHGVPTGLHFNISEGVPVREHSTYKTLTNDEGHFLGMHELRKFTALGQIDLQEVKEELKAQIARYTELIGSRPVYVDGHQHAHLLTGLVETFAQTLSEHGVQATRLSYEPNLDSATWLEENEFRPFFYMVNSDSQNARPVMKTHNIWASDAFFGLSTMGSYMTAQRLQTGIKGAFGSVGNSEHGGHPITCELMTHPGYQCQGAGGCGEGADDFSKSPDREYEKSILESVEMKTFYTANNITPMSYHDCLKAV